ncbi:DUF502 domain-containing protein [Gallaecimonas sp. GXIMD4217]|uniref:DUF502 domain-containing protein n=1 Tax=Gallaecimonas sp. GXIMD4217 TaxID=3131927 RepID=UPI00311AEF69
MRKPLRWLVQGMLVLAPVILTFYMLWALYRFLEQNIFTPVGNWLLPLLGISPPQWLMAPLGMVLALLLVMLVGMLTGNFLGGRLLRLVDGALSRMPLVKLLYSAIKDVLTAIFGEDRRFSNPVLVTLGEGVQLIGFMTRDNMAELALDDHVAVYLPQSFNFAGNLILVPRDKVQPLAVSAGDVLPLVVAGGVSKQNGNGSSQKPC